MNPASRPAHAAPHGRPYAARMTGRRDDEQTDLPLPQRSTDSESATKFPTPQSGVVQDSPGNPDLELEGDSRVDEQGNMRTTDRQD